MKYHSVKLAQKKKRKNQLKVILTIIVLTSFIFGLSFLSKVDFLSIKDIKIVGNKVVSEKGLKEIIENNLLENYFYLFSKKNILIYPKEKIKKDIQSHYPQIKNVNLNVSLQGILNLNLEERVPYALWCKNASSTECFFVDDEGYLFEKTLDINNNDFFRYEINPEKLISGFYFLLWEKESPLRQKVLENIEFKKVDSLVRFIKGIGLNPFKFVEKGDKCEIYFGKQSSKIIFNKRQNIKEVINNLQSVLNMEEFSNIENLKKLEYIDLRFGNKVFYK